MTKRFIRILLCVSMIFCFFGSFNVYAEETTLDYEINIQPVVSEPETQEETEEQTEERVTEEETTQKVTEKETTEKETTKKPTKAPVREPEREDEDNDRQDVNVNADSQTTTTTEEQTTEEPLPEGHFYVYLQKNNGERILKTIMEGEGLVPEPNEPLRKGYLFDGWYSDSKFKKPWNFYNDIAKGKMTIYAKWIADESTVTYDITVKQVKGGKIEVNPGKASEGEYVTVTVTPDEGKRLVAGSLLVNGEPTDILSFKMPKGKVVVTASFEDIPESAKVEEEDKSIVPIIIGAVIVVAIIALVAVALMKRRAIYESGFDPDEMLEAEDEYDDGWVDETIVVEDGFKEGKIVRENVEPDFGLPDSDEDE